MILKTNQNADLLNSRSFFDFWHFHEMEEPITVVSSKISEEASVSESIKAKQICKELPDHCAQLLFVS
jgi:hypothetical protein